MSLSMFGPVSGGALFDREEEVEYISKHCVESVKKPGCLQSHGRLHRKIRPPA